MSKIAVNQKIARCRLSCRHLSRLSLFHELTARMFGNPEKYEYLCNSKIKQ